jgi:CPA2 family monovalent cation:H+ antiporter-2
VFGMALAVASTVVLMRMLVAQDRLSGRDGHVAVGWLIVEDLFTVVALVMLPALAAERSDPAGVAGALGLALGKAAVFAALVWLVGSRLVAPAMERVARTRSTELFTLTVFVVALGVALLAAEVFAVSVALGAFFAGLVVGQSRFGPQAAADMAPFRDVFSALFFVSVGMLFNPAVVTSQPLVLAGAIVLVVKPAVALAIVKLLRDTERTALTVGVGLAQIGEFSFILGVLGLGLGLLPPEGMDILVATAIVSIAVNPLLFRAVAAREARLAAAADEAPAAAVAPAAETAPATVPAVMLTGLGEIGRRVIQRCADAGVPLAVVDPDPETLAGLRGRGLAVVCGDPADPEVLRAAGMADARMIVVTNPTLAEKMQICVAARQANPRIAIVATSASGAERAWLHEFGAAFVCDAIDEMTESLVRTVRGGL